MFKPLRLKNLVLPNRIIRAATFDNMATPDGLPTEAQAALFSGLAKGGAGTIITGFAYVSRQGRAMQPFQAGIDHDDKIGPWACVLAKVRRANPETKVLLQIAHTGRQTISKATGRPVVGAGPVRCTYFLAPVRPLSEKEVGEKVKEFVTAALRAEKAGFDGIQIHAAHGYLIHQFLSPHTNRRKDRYGEDPVLFLEDIVSGIRQRSTLPIFLKLSGSEDQPRGITIDLMQSYVKRISGWDIDAIEVSYGTMEIPLNIIRGDIPFKEALRHNYLFARFGKVFAWFFSRFIYSWYKTRFIVYSDLYNLENAKKIKRISRVPVLVTGGIRTKSQISAIIHTHGLDGVTLCRPFICEPDFVNKLRTRADYQSRCINCNLCTVMSDSTNPLRCYLGNRSSCSS